ncbi:6-phosphogluconolactonase [Paenibacillus silvisoli]|uniref:6-phosphogluconolactonase n=1 Tax=Paenibacillus silvisoli TaxID=3110539 RepID=UPI002805A810|nr:glucosamine-6-phosphate deaminase [Paenibacillus silvisoli]
MELIVLDNYEELSAEAANIVKALIRHKPDATLGLTTGNSPIGLYRELVRSHYSSDISLERVRIFCLEEYLGVQPDDRRSLFGWLNDLIIAPCAVPGSQVYRLKGEDPEPQISCEQFERAIKDAGGFDLVVEGIGTNAHIGFNEPGSSEHSRTRIVSLNESTINYNFQYWNSAVPSYGMTAGISTLLSSKHILLLASGQNKAESLARALTGKISPDVPASYLQRSRRLTVVADRDAASQLSGL